MTVFSLVGGRYHTSPACQVGVCCSALPPLPPQTLGGSLFFDNYPPSCMAVDGLGFFLCVVRAVGEMKFFEYILNIRDLFSNQFG